jgi:hypothetical protein
MAELSYEDRHYVPARDYYDRFSLLSEQNARSLLLGVRLAKVFEDRDKAASGPAITTTLSRYAGISAIPVGAMMKAAHPEVVAATRQNPVRLAPGPRKQWLVAGRSGPQAQPHRHSLSNLEAGAFDKLPGHTFARGYIRAYAKLLGMDQAVLVQQFDQSTGTDAKAATCTAWVASKSRCACRTPSCALSACCC